MKKILRLTAFIALLFTAIHSKAQLLDGSIAPDWTFTDINNVSHNLYSYLDAGKTVYIDVSATWCGPCWTYHNTHAFNQLWIDHGPIGGQNVSPTTTNDVMVFFIEGDGATTNAQLNGIGSTQGNWVAGVDHPIIDPPTAQINPFKTDYNIGYFPTIYMICPDRTITEVSQISAAQLYAKRSTCSFATATSDAEVMPSSFLNVLESCDSVTPIFRIANVGTSNLTSATLTYMVDAVNQKTFQWTGNLVTYANTTVTGVKVSSATSGTHTITATISNPNGTVDPTTANNSKKATFVKYSTVTGPYIVESFETAGIPSTWGITNEGDPTTWANSNTGYNSSKSAFLSWCYMNGGDDGSDILTLDAMSFTSATAPQLTFDLAHCQQYSVGNGRLKVEISTDCGTTWTAAYDKAGSALSTVALLGSPFTPTSGQWRHETVDLSAYSGQPHVLVRFKGTPYYSNNLYIDNVNVTGATSIEEVEALNSVSIYPNPVMSEMVEFSINSPTELNIKIEVLDVMGKKVMEQNYGKISSGTTNYSLPFQNIPAGIYSLIILTNENYISRKFAVER